MRVFSKNEIQKLDCKKLPAIGIFGRNFFLYEIGSFSLELIVFFVGILLLFLKTRRLFRQDIWQGHKIISVKKKFHKYHINLQFV